MKKLIMLMILLIPTISFAYLGTSKLLDGTWSSYEYKNSTFTIETKNRNSISLTFDSIFCGKLYSTTFTGLVYGDKYFSAKLASDKPLFIRHNGKKCWLYFPTFYLNGKLKSESEIFLTDSHIEAIAKCEGKSKTLSVELNGFWRR